MPAPGEVPPQPDPGLVSLSGEPAAPPPPRPAAQPPLRTPMPSGIPPHPFPTQSPASAASQPAPEPVAPSFMETVETTGRVPFSTEAALSGMSRRPVPSSAALVGNILVWGSAAFGINAVMAMTGALALPGGVVTPFGLGVAFAAGLVVMGLGSFLGAGVVHLLALLSGGKGDFGRGLQTVSLLAFVAPLSALAGAAPNLWMAAALYSSVMLARAISLLYGAPIIQAGIIVGAVSLLGGVGQYQARQKLAQLQERAQQMQEMAVQAQAAASAAQGGTPASVAALQRSSMDLLQNAQRMALDPAVTKGMTPEQAQALQQILQTASGAAGTAPAQGTGTSGLDLLQSPGTGAGLPLTLPPGGQPTPQQVQQAGLAGAAMIDRVGAIFSDPKTTQGMTPQQLKAFKQMQGLVQGLQGSMHGGPPPDTKALMSQLSQVMSEMQAMPQSGAKKRASPPPAQADPPPGDPLQRDPLQAAPAQP